jgi:hypothetical protein
MPGITPIEKTKSSEEIDLGEAEKALSEKDFKL